MSAVTHVEYDRKPTSLLMLAGLFVFLSLFDYYRLSSLPLLRTPSATVGLLLAACYGLYALSGYRIHSGTPMWFWVFFLGIVATQLLRIAAGGDAQWPFFMQWVQIIILAMILVDLSRDPRAFNILLGAIVIAALFLAIAGSLGVSQVNNGRVGYEDIDLNRQANVYTLGLLTLLWLMIERTRTFRLWQMACLIAGCVVLMVAALKTGSRGGFLTMIAGVGLLLLLEARKRNSSAYVFFIPPMLLIALAMIASNDLVIGRLIGTLNGQEDNSRIVIWENALQLLMNHPLVGNGPYFMERLGSYFWAGRILNAHNGYLQVLLAFGIPVFLLWLGMVGSVLRRCWRVRQAPEGALLLSLMITMLLFGFTIDLAFDRFFWFVLVLAANVERYPAFLRRQLLDGGTRHVTTVARRP